MTLRPFHHLVRRALPAAALLLSACSPGSGSAPTTGPAPTVAAPAAAAKTSPPATTASPAAPSGQGAAAKPGPATGSFSLYTSVPQEIVNRMQATLKRVQPDLSMQVFRGGTSEVVAKLAAEQRAGAIQADVLWVAEPSSYESLKKQNLLLKFTPAAADTLAADLKDPDGYYYAGRLINTIIIYNTQQVKTAPTNWRDLLDPAYSGKVVLPTPANSGAAVAFAGALSGMPGFGWDYFDKLKANGAKQVSNNTQANERVASGEAVIGSTLDYMIRDLKAKGSPVDGAWPEEGAIFTPSPVGVLAASKNQAPARAFVDYLLSREGQQDMVEVGNFIPIRDDVEPPKGAPRLREIKRAPVDWKVVAEQEQRIKDQFAERFGS